jgi:hypothetical protein
MVRVGDQASWFFVMTLQWNKENGFSQVSMDGTISVPRAEAPHDVYRRAYAVVLKAGREQFGYHGSPSSVVFYHAEPNVPQSR